MGAPVSWALKLSQGTDVEVKKQTTNTEGKSESWEALDGDHQKGVANSQRGQRAALSQKGRAPGRNRKLEIISSSNTAKNPTC